MKIGIVRFPGSNCDADCLYTASRVLGEEGILLWHEDPFPPDLDLVILPGGFAHGDYLRAGAMAKFSPMMKSIREFADRGGFVLGICNGFQILTEAGLLPGAFLRNLHQKFICDWVFLRVENEKTPFTSAYRQGEVIRMPVAHGEGRYFLDSSKVKDLEWNRQIVFRYSSPAGELGEEFNVNGSVSSIAGICNKAQNVLGLMPHPERCSEPILQGADGHRLFQSLQSVFRRSSRVSTRTA